MSAICSGNPSQLQAGRPPSMVIDAAYAQSLLPDGWEFLYPFLYMFRGLAIGDTSAFCVADPPTLGLPTTEDFYNFVLGGPFGQGQIVNEFLEDVVRAYLWHSICECTVVSTPAPPSALTDPGNLPAVNPSDIVHLPSVTPCYVGPHIGPVTVTQGVGPTFTGFGLLEFHHPITTGRVTSTLSGTGVFAVTWEVRTQREHSPVGVGPNYTFTQGVGTVVKDIPYDPEWPSWAIYRTGGPGTGTLTWDLDFDFYCNGDVPDGNQSECCPPDPALRGILFQILSSVELIQRQLAPFAYIASTSHTGLTGAGQIAVSGLLGARILVTDSLPGAVGEEAGSPPALFNLGWINWGSADGFTTREFLSAEETLSLPPAAGAYTIFAYSLAPGVEITMQELVREP